MALRGFGYKTITGTSSQPAFGTVLTAASVLTPDIFTGRTNPGSNPSSSTLSVGSSYGFFFQKGDKVIVGTGTLSGGIYVWDGGMVTAVNTTNGNLTIKGLTTTHAVGEYIILCANAGELHIRAGGSNTGAIYVGPDPTVSSTSQTLYDVISNTAASPVALGISGSGNVWNTQGIWLLGTAADTFLAGYNSI